MTYLIFYVYSNVCFNVIQCDAPFITLVNKQLFEATSLSSFFNIFCISINCEYCSIIATEMLSLLNHVIIDHTESTMMTQFNSPVLVSHSMCIVTQNSRLMNHVQTKHTMEGFKNTICLPSTIVLVEKYFDQTKCAW